MLNEFEKNIAGSSNDASDWQPAIDRLVDGELNAEEERLLLSKLDHVSDGWRTCALAFVEARVWQAAMREVVTTTSAATGGLTSPAQVERKKKLHSVQWANIAVAAMVAFVLGVLVRNFQTPQHENGIPIVKTGVPNNSIYTTPYTAPGEVVNASLFSPMSESLQLNMVDSKGQYPAQSVNVPLVKLNKWDPQILSALQKWSEEQPLPKEIMQEAGFNGQQIIRKSVLMPVKTADGTQIIVPVQQLHFQPREKQVWH